MKTQIRHKYIKWRDDMKKEDAEALGVRIRKNFEASGLGNVPEGQAVMLYASFRNEADTWGIIGDLSEKGVKVVLPRTRKAGLELYEYRGPESLKLSRFGILEPDPELCPAADSTEIGLVVVPGVVFDRRGGRIGFGAGYYDRFLPTVPDALKAGLCYEAQIAEEVPCDENDVRMDVLLTEKGLFNCQTQSYTEL
jgi:5-formyltetrahydrofolate cyclo-ligase